MAKKQGTQDPSLEAGGQNGKREKKLAKQEAKAMLAVDTAREKLAKAERKLANAQLRVEARLTSLRAAEAHLAELRDARQAASVSRAASNGTTAEGIASSESPAGMAGETSSAGEPAGTGAASDTEEPVLVIEEFTLDESSPQGDGTPEAGSEMQETQETQEESEPATAGESAESSEPGEPAESGTEAGEDANGHASPEDEANQGIW
jgi:hypothetical protein